MSIDWCETNFSWSPYVAEWWNTWSSLGYCAVGIIGFRSIRREKNLWKYRLQYAWVFSIGLGSIAFHATLSSLGQAIDETAMISCIFSGLLTTTKKRTETGWLVLAWLAALCTYVIGSYLVFLGIFGTATLILGRRSWVLARECRDIRVANLTIVSILATGFAFFLFWLPEFLLCVPFPIEERGKLQYMHTHSVWHVLTAFGVHTSILSSILREVGRTRDITQSYFPSIV